MEQTPVSEIHNEDLLRMIPREARFLVEVGCSSGALAREYRKLNGAARYVGVEIEPGYAELAKRHCDEVILGDVEALGEEFWDRHSSGDCWIFADVLEHLKDPWETLGRIRNVIPGNGSVLCCIPNVQHWSVLARISVGDSRYEATGLLDRTHLRWFTRKTILETFAGCGFAIAELRARILQEPGRERFLAHIGRLAGELGGNPDEAMADACAFQFLLRAVPS